MSHSSIPASIPKYRKPTRATSSSVSETSSSASVSLASIPGFRCNANNTSACVVSEIDAVATATAAFTFETNQKLPSSNTDPSPNDGASDDDTDNGWEEDFRSAIRKRVPNTVESLVNDFGYTDYPISKAEMLHLVSRNSKKNKRILECIATKCKSVYFNEEIVLKALKYKWDNAVYSLIMNASRDEHSHVNKITSIKCIVKIIKIGDEYLSKRVLRKDLDYLHFHEPILVYLCQEGDLKLLTYIFNTSTAGSVHSNSRLLNAAARHQKVVDFLRDRGAMEGGTAAHKQRLETAVAVRMAGNWG